jgi:hypothetical protein
MPPSNWERISWIIALKSWPWPHRCSYRRCGLSRVKELALDSAVDAQPLLRRHAQLWDTSEFFDWPNEWPEISPVGASLALPWALLLCCERYHVAQTLCRATRLIRQCTEAWIASLFLAAPVTSRIKPRRPSSGAAIEFGRTQFVIVLRGCEYVRTKSFGLGAVL